MRLRLRFDPGLVLIALLTLWFVSLVLSDLLEQYVTVSSLDVNTTVIVDGAERLYACIGENVSFVIRYEASRPWCAKVMCDIPWVEDRPLLRRCYPAGSGVAMLNVTAAEPCRTLYLVVYAVGGRGLEVGDRVVVTRCG